MKNKVFKFLSVAILATFTLASCSDDNTDIIKPQNELGGSIGSRTLYADTVYILDRFVVVDSLETVTIQAGTIIKAKRGSGPNASAFIVARGGKINAVGTADKPIIFTSVDDNIQPGEIASSLGVNTRGLWGGVIILGNAPVSVGNGDVVGIIEGVPASFPFSKYGGDNPADNSGSFQFVSIRYSGSELVKDQEIQGLTLGGVGSGTKVSDIEIVASDDDGIEIFGGTVDVENILVAYQSDDALDLDQNYSGTLSNCLVLVNNAAINNDGAEIDGPENTTYTTGKFTIQNSTFINLSGSSAVATLKSHAQGTIKDCVFQDFNVGIWVRGNTDIGSGAIKSAVANYLSEDLKVENCQFNFSGTVREFMNATNDEEDIRDLFEAAGNEKVAKADFTKGADLSKFDWTWMKARGLF